MLLQQLMKMFNNYIEYTSNKNNNEYKIKIVNDNKNTKILNCVYNVIIYTKTTRTRHFIMFIL